MQVISKSGLDGWRIREPFSGSASTASRPGSLKGRALYGWLSADALALSFVVIRETLTPPVRLHPDKRAHSGWWLLWARLP